LLEISSELFDHLERDGTLVVPTRQRAAALRLAHTAAQLRFGREVWSSPDVLPWSAWLERGLSAARMRGLPVPRRLSSAEEWLLWRDAVREACAGLPVLSPDALIDSVRRAVELLEDYGLEPRAEAAPEAAVLLQARARLQQRCDELGALRSSSWRACVPYLRPEPAALVLGFRSMGPALREWLERLGVSIEPQGRGSRPSQIEAAQAEPLRIFDNPEQEAEAAAEWCATQLARDPAARLLLVVMELRQQRHWWERALSQRLDYRLILEPSLVPAESAFVIEGGQPLQRYALIDSALKLIGLACGQGDFDALSAVLRSPFLGALGREPRLRIDVWLREHNIGAGRLPRLDSLLAPLTRALGESAALSWRALSEALRAIEPEPQTALAAPAQWAQRFAALLARLGWPGEALGSAEQQVRMRFEQLLGEFATVALSAPRLSRQQAGEWLFQLAARVAFEPASDDVPVTVSSSLDDPIVRYDGIWVAGLSAEAWPQAACPDPLIPTALQEASGMQLASATGQLQLANESLRRWRQATAHLVLSCARSDGELPLAPSPLLSHGADGARADELSAQPSEQVFVLEPWIGAQAPALEDWSDLHGLAWPAQRALRGGTYLLELQSLCPFRGFAQTRLRARPLPEPTPGIDARLRGQILHRALELFWSSMRDSATLQQHTAAQRLTVVHSSVELALTETQTRLAASIEPTLLEREGERAAQLLLELIAWELRRAPFQAQRLEWSQPCTIAGATLQLRLDRVDRLEDGALVVIDYKSGAVRAFDAYSPRSVQPQLLAYAMAAGERTAAVLALYCGREGLKVRGIADHRGRLPDLREAAPDERAWPGLLRQWSQQLQDLMQEYLRGHAAVQPQRGACEICHLQAFCRIEQPA
jgi:ATP-dependent helicase/nuclease subunit B